MYTRFYDNEHFKPDELGHFIRQRRGKGLGIKHGARGRYVIETGPVVYGAGTVRIYFINQNNTIALKRLRQA